MIDRIIRYPSGNIIFYRKKSAINVITGIVTTDNTVVKEKISDA